MNRSNPEDNGVILDPFCFVHLRVTEHFEEILLCSGHRFAIDGYVLRHEGPLPAPEDGTSGVNRDIESAVSRGLLAILELESDAEALTYLGMVSELEDGEARACALALHRGLGLATDEAKVRRLMRLRAPKMLLPGTPELLRRWAERSRLQRSDLRATLERIREAASYVPIGDDADSRWWRSMLR